MRTMAVVVVRASPQNSALREVVEGGYAALELGGHFEARIDDGHADAAAGPRRVAQTKSGTQNSWRDGRSLRIGPVWEQNIHQAADQVASQVEHAAQQTTEQTLRPHDGIGRYGQH